MWSSTCFEHPSVHTQEDLYTKLYGISFMLRCKQYGGWQEAPGIQAHPAIDQTALYGCMKYHKTACKCLPEDERLDVRNMSKTL